MEFAEAVEEFKMTTKENIGNLTCVLADMGLLDANLNINKNFYRNEMWQQVSSVKSLRPYVKSP